MLRHVDSRDSSASTNSDGVTVLIIDDDRVLQAALVDILGILPHMVVYAASNGREGLQVFQQLRQSVSLVLLDLDMPVMNGEETYARLRQVAPRVKVIVSSSHSQAVARLRFRKYELPVFLQKPYDANALLTAVRTMLAIT